MSKKLSTENILFNDIKQLIQSARQRAFIAVNTELTLLYWQVGNRIAKEILGGERAEYGKQVMANLAKNLTRDCGRGWSIRNLEQMIKFIQVFPDFQIAQTLSAQLSWSHFKALT